MPITSQQLVERAIHKLAPPGASVEQVGQLRGSLSVHVKSALEGLGKRIADGDDFHNLQKEFSLTAVAGRIDLSAAPSNGILFHPYRAQVYVGSSDEPAIYVERPETLKSGGLNNDSFYYSHRGQILIFLNTDGQTNSLAGTVKVVANFVPAITEVPAEHEKTLTDVLVEIAMSAASLEKTTLDAREGADEGRA